jgi:predicted O-methyltransferase YrrM
MAREANCPIAEENMVAPLKAAFRRLVGEQAAGAFDYLLKPGRGAEWGGPFNGQPFRRALFLAIVEQLRPVAVVETGTYCGVTTQFMAQTKLRVFTVESNARKHGFARTKLWRQRNVKLLLQDSRSALRDLLDGPLSGLTSSCLFFYLDAHWNEDLPLADELQIILRRCASPVIMIDDFQVPDDAGYGYDDYGPGKALTPVYIEPAITAHGARALYPATRSSDEGGARRGCVVLVKDVADGQTLASMPLLRAASR